MYVNSARRNCVVTLDVHNLAAYQNAFRCSTEHLEAAPLFVRHFTNLSSAYPMAIVAPDEGGVKRAEHVRRMLAEAGNPQASFVFVEKRRSGGVVTGDALVGDVKGRTAVVVDDMISTGTTLRRAASACRLAGASAVWAVASHGLFLSGSETLFTAPELDKVIVTDSIDQERHAEARSHGRLVVLDLSPLLATAIHRLHVGGSLTELSEHMPPPKSTGG